MRFVSYHASESWQTLLASGNTLARLADQVALHVEREGGPHDACLVFAGAVNAMQEPRSFATIHAVADLLAQHWAYGTQFRGWCLHSMIPA